MSLLSSYGVGVSLHDQLLRRLNRVKEAKLLVCTPPKRVGEGLLQPEEYNSLLS